MNLQNKVALVTGGGAGIGRSIAIDLAMHGADVMIVDRQSTDEVVDEIKKIGRKVFAAQADVSSFDDSARAVAATLESLGRLDLLINNAGINKDGVVWKMTEEQWDAVIDVNLKGCFNFIRAVAPIFKEQKSGKIVNITSINGLRGKFGQANYAASKAGIIGLTKTVARELGKFNVNVNAVAPGMVETEMMRVLPQDVKDKSISETVLERVAQPEDIAHVVTFLCSDYARHITGEVIKVDGGQYI
ncbi:MAG: 3-oxoacyl-ACP reductase FabG [Chloroflexi bacterium]|nr:3-oxoacyl-ACP reductase FabG [Chloroflexota bacterium]MBI5714352.1 3-oxoacyl-ACP reductase FabG [Chloroflexota bacterium]